MFLIIYVDLICNNISWVFFKVILFLKKINKICLYICINIYIIILVGKLNF